MRILLRVCERADRNSPLARQGNRVAIMGAGGIGFDVATFLAHRRAKVEPETIEHFNNKWGIDGGARGGVKQSAFAPAERTIYLLQRKNEKLGSRLGKTTVRQSSVPRVAASSRVLAECRAGFTARR